MPCRHPDHCVYEYSRSGQDSTGEGSPDRDLCVVPCKVAQRRDAPAKSPLSVSHAVEHLFFPGGSQGPRCEVNGAGSRIADQVNVGVDKPGNYRQVVPTGGRCAHHLGDRVTTPGHSRRTEFRESVPGGDSVELHARRE